MATRKRRRDPHADREATNYDHPVASREHLLDVLSQSERPLGLEAIATAVGLQNERDVESLRRRLSAMRRDGQLTHRRGTYAVSQDVAPVNGRVIGHREGFGFLVPDGEGSDLFLSAREMRGVVHGDRVAAREISVDRQGRREGAVVTVLERNTTRVVGQFVRENEETFVRPDNSRIHHVVSIPPAARGSAVDGQYVVVELTRQPTAKYPPQGQVVEVLGDAMAPGMEIDIAIRAHDLRQDWPADAEREAAKFGTKVPARAARGRADLRDLPLVTIDGADAKDFDDAVYCEPKPKGWKLLVAIADVAAYVKPSSPLDEEARLRGNSVYFPEKVLPMLPEALSNGLCSLRPDEDRLCMVCDMYVTRDGQVLRSTFYEAIIRSHARLTYDQVAHAIVDGDPEGREQLGELVPHLDELYRLFHAMRRAKEQRGSLELDLPEPVIVFDADRKISRVDGRLRNDAHRIIEECMIAANVCAARFLSRHRIPTLYRVHEGPTNEKLAELRTFLKEVGVRMGGGATPEPQHFAALLARVAGRPDCQLIQTVMLRTLAQAVYTPKNAGHFGLALTRYAHFTSPIRRYADLVVHRGIKHALKNPTGGGHAYPPTAMPGIGEHISMTERKADDATRDAVAWLKCEFMLDKCGQAFGGAITGVTAFGLFVTLDDVFVDGLVHISTLGKEYFRHDAAQHRLEGERSGTTYQLGDKLTVRVKQVNLDDRKIDFELVGGKTAGRKVTPKMRSTRQPGRRRRT